MVTEQLNKVRKDIPSNVRLVAVSKYHPIETLKEAYNAGQRIFGESRVQELETKRDSMPEDVDWHFIGHLQTNKIKYIAPYVTMIHAVDSVKLLSEINKQAAKVGRKIECLLQLHIADEETKYGMSTEECFDMLKEGQWKTFDNVSIAGVMGMATNTDDMEQVRHEFKTLKAFFEKIKKEFFSTNENFKEISMGMSHDYKIAIEEGSTLVRVGSLIFGERQY